ncbi:MAG: NUDIX domain-containing protein, partial [Bacteroidota bacterium]
MYKIFYFDRVIKLSNQKALQGQIYNYTSKERLIECIRNFETDSSVATLNVVHDDPAFLLSEMMSLYEVIEAAGGLVKNEAGQVLMIFRRNKWDLPKGKIDEGENPEQAAIREVNEETGIQGHFITRKITVTYHTYYLNDKPVLKPTHWFEMKYNGTETPVPERDEGI